MVTENPPRFYKYALQIAANEANRAVHELQNVLLLDKKELQMTSEYFERLFTSNFLQQAYLAARIKLFIQLACHFAIPFRSANYGWCPIPASKRSAETCKYTYCLLYTIRIFIFSTTLT
jgi:hypothetical protein